MSTSDSDKLWKQQVATTFLLINKISLAACILLTIVIGVFVLLKFRAAKRLSFRLYFWLALCDIFTHAPIIPDYLNDYILCQVANVLVMWANFFTVLITSIMAVNLHLVFILDRPDLVKSERFYVFWCAVISIVLTLPMLALVIHDPPSCPYYTQFEFPYDRVALLFLYGNWVLIPTLYCFYVFIRIVLKLTIHSNGSSPSSDGSITKKQNKIVVKRMVIRLMLYPLVPVFTMLPYLTVIAIEGPTNYSNVSHFIQYSSATVQGLLNFYFFLFDPALPSIFEEIKERIFSQSKRKEAVLPVDRKAVSCELNELPVIFDNKSNSLQVSIELNRLHTESIDQVELISSNSRDGSRNSTSLANPRLLI